MLEVIEDFCSNVMGASHAKVAVSQLLSFRPDNYPTLHPYGFHIWKIETPPAFEFSLRLHAWISELRQRQSPDWPPHSHNSDLHSLVMEGEVSNYTWGWLPSKVGDRSLYEVGYDGNLSTLTKTEERGFLYDGCIHKIARLQNYLVPMQQIHASEVRPEASAVTLVLLSRKSVGSPKVIGDLEGNERYVFNRQEVNVDTMTKARDLVAKCLVGLIER